MHNTEEFWSSVDRLFFKTQSDSTLAQLEKKLRQDKDSIETRIEIAGYYLQKADVESPRLKEIALWFMKNYPEAKYIYHMFLPAFSPHDKNTFAAYLAAERLWIKIASDNYNSIPILQNALLFVELCSKTKRKLLQRICELAPKNLIYKENLFSYEVENLTSLSPSMQKKVARNLLKTFYSMEISLRNLHLRKNGDVLFSLIPASKCAQIARDFQNVKRLCAEILSVKKWPYQEESTACIHQDALNTWGLAALNVDDERLARNCLKKASKIRFPKNMIPWMYPNTALAEQLLSLGYRKDVIEFMKSYPESLTAEKKTFSETIPLLKQDGKVRFIQAEAATDAFTALMLLEHGQSKRAIKSMKVAESSNRKGAKEFFYLSLLQSRLGESKKAIINLKKAFDLEPDLIERAHAQKDLENIISSANSN